MDNILFHVVNTLLVSGSLYLIYRASKKQVPMGQDGFYVLRMQKSYLYGGFVSFLLGVAGIAMPFAANEFSREILISSSVILILFGGLGFYMIMLYRNHYVQFNHELMVVQDALGHSTSVFFASIQSVKYSGVSGSILINQGSGKSVRIYEHLVGFPQIIQQIREVNAKAMEHIK
jgi:hypothetical protein